MIHDFISNHVFMSVLTAMFICEVWKFIDSSARLRKIHWGSLVDTGGMPSSHSTFVCSLAVAVGIDSGFTSNLFFIAAGFAIVVVRDAFGVRRSVDKLAKTVNEIIKKKKIDVAAYLSITGHTPIQAAIGCLLGIVVPILMKILFFR